MNPVNPKHINTLIEDVYELLCSPNEHIDEEHLDTSVKAALDNIGKVFIKTIKREESLPSDREIGKYWASDLGTDCFRKLWYKFNIPDEAETLLPHTLNKFMFGSLIEESVLMLAILAGHRVEGLQEVHELNIGDDITVRGRTDAIIDGYIVDVKSCSSFAFKKYTKEKAIKKEDDNFGYRMQLGFYLAANKTPGVSRDKGYFLLQDKTLGHLSLVEPEYGDDIKPDAIRQRALDIHKAVSSKTPPPRLYRDVPEGKSGNKKLGVACSYCDFKHVCWPGLRTFIGYKGPVYLTEVKRVPRMVEVTNTNGEESEAASEAA
ncbi:MAG: hypothetical protein D6711_03350 [Chloroflexi bacterium]|nr:MAG: hypothetical protein D6711_03350 [Chloroflexota bacterium]